MGEDNLDLNFGSTSLARNLGGFGSSLGKLFIEINTYKNYVYSMKSRTYNITIQELERDKVTDYQQKCEERHE